jgi:arginase family enzyme
MLDLVSLLGDLPLGGVDLVEVAPAFDPSKRTPALAAGLLYKILGSRVFDFAPFAPSANQ